MWQLYVTSFPEWDLGNLKPLEFFCWTVYSFFSRPLLFDGLRDQENKCMWCSAITPKGHVPTLLTKKLKLRRSDIKVRARGMLTAVV